MNAEAAALEEGRFDRILGIAHYAEMHDQPLAAEKAYRLASAVPSLELEGFEGLLRMAMRQGNSGAYLDLTRETTVKWTSNEHYAELHLYACLLVGEDLETNAKRAEALLESRPGDSMRKLLAAIARYREGNPSAAVRCLDHISMEELTSGQVAVIGGIYSAAGQPHIASDISRRVGTVELLPEEERLLKQARRAQ